MTDNLPVKLLIGLVPSSISTRMVLEALLYSPEQTSLSQFPLLLTHPRTRKTKVLSEFVEELLGDSRFAIETKTHLVYVSRIFRNLKTHEGTLFIPTAVYDKSTKQLKILTGEK